MSSDDEQTRVATVQVTNDAWTDELQHLIGLLEREFYVDAQMADGKLHVIREPRGSSSSSKSQEGESMSLAERREYVDELLDGLRDRIETVRQFDRDIADGRTSTLEEVREELDGDGTDDAHDVEAQVDAAVDSFEKKVEKLDEDSSDEEAETQTDDDRPTCQHCGDTFDPRGLKRHEQRCDENPENATEDSEDEEKRTR